MKDKVKRLVEEADLLDPQNDELWVINWRKRIGCCKNARRPWPTI